MRVIRTGTNVNKSEVIKEYELEVVDYQSLAKMEPVDPLSTRDFGLAAPEPGKDFDPEINLGDASPFVSICKHLQLWSRLKQCLTILQVKAVPRQEHH